jgi:hypothetical protein
MYREPELTEMEKAVDYDHSLLLAADEVISRLEDLVYDKTCRALVRMYAKSYNVAKRDLAQRVRELM